MLVKLGLLGVGVWGLPGPSVSVGGGNVRYVYRPPGGGSERYVYRPPSADVAYTIASRCGTQPATPLTTAATSLATYCTQHGTSAGISVAPHVTPLGLPIKHCSAYVIGVHGDDGYAVDEAFARTDICGRGFLGAARVGMYLAVIGCSFWNEYVPDYNDAPQDPVQPPPSPVDDPIPPPPEQTPDLPSDDPPPPPPPSGGYGSDFNGSCMTMTNTFRSQAGLPPLVPDSLADSICADQSSCMARTGNLSHSACSQFSSRMGRFGVNAVAAENIAWNVLDPVRVAERWYDSPGHRANILKSNVNVGACCIVGEYATQVFYQRNDY